MKSIKQRTEIVLTAAAVLLLAAAPVGAQTYPPRTAPTPPKPAQVIPQSVAPPDFVIGADDVLTIVVWGEQQLSGDYTVRPDGKISMLQLEEIVVAGLKPEELKKKIIGYLPKFYEEPLPEVHVAVKTINSRKVYVQGAVRNEGPVVLTGPIKFSQLVSMFGGFQEFAKKKEIRVISGTQKNAKGEPMTWVINYEDIEQGKNLIKNDILLHPGDVVIVRGG
jgi:polysaccharide export outer membrane protein